MATRYVLKGPKGYPQTLNDGSYPSFDAARRGFSTSYRFPKPAAAADGTAAHDVDAAPRRADSAPQSDARRPPPEVPLDDQPVAARFDAAAAARAEDDAGAPRGAATANGTGPPAISDFDLDLDMDIAPPLERRPGSVDLPLDIPTSPPASRGKDTLDRPLTPLQKLDMISNTSSLDPAKARHLEDLVREMQAMVGIAPEPTESMLNDIDPNATIEDIAHRLEEVKEYMRGRIEAAHSFPAPGWPDAAAAASSHSRRLEPSSMAPASYQPIPPSPALPDTHAPHLEPAPSSAAPQPPPVAAPASAPAPAPAPPKQGSIVYPDREKADPAQPGLLAVQSVESQALPAREHSAASRSGAGAVPFPRESSGVSRSSGGLNGIPSLGISQWSSRTSIQNTYGGMQGVLDFNNIRRSDFDLIYHGDFDEGTALRVAAGHMYRTERIADVWEFDKLLGEGASGKVKRARSKVDPSKEAAVKIMNKRDIKYKYVSREIFSFRIISQAREHAGAKHAVQLWEVYEDDDKIYLVMELLSGGPLFRRISTRAHTEAECAKIARDMLLSVSYLHDLNITHRDIKPENFVYSSSDPDGVLKLTDFGTSTYYDDPNAAMKTMLGTVIYVAPEVFLKQPYGQEVDVWAVGIVVYQMLVGHPPFEDEDNAEIVSKVKYQPVPYDRRDWLFVSEEAQQFCSLMLEKDPRKRYSADQLLRHSWITSGGCAGSNPLDTAQKKIQSYVSRQLWKKAGTVLIANSKFTAVYEAIKKEEAKASESPAKTTVKAPTQPVDPHAQAPQLAPKIEAPPLATTQKAHVVNPPMEVPPKTIHDIHESQRPAGRTKPGRGFCSCFG